MIRALLIGGYCLLCYIVGAWHGWEFHKQWPESKTAITARNDGQELDRGLIARNDGDSHGD